MQRVLTNDFSWSKSRHEKFRECLRAYYLHYYGSWGGWEENAPEEARELYLLKKLSNRFTWAGSAVHDAIRDVMLDLKAGRPVDPERVLERAHRRMQEDFRLSRRKSYRTRKIRKAFSGLVEHEYEEAVPPEEWKRTWAGAEQALRWFLASRWVGLGQGLKAHEWLEVDEGALHSNLEHRGVRFFAIPDLAYQEPGGGVVVVDWKTGKARDGYEDQVTGYALYVSRRYRVPVEQVRAVLVYLNEGVETEVPVGREDVERFDAHFVRSVEGMRALLADVPANRPLPVDAFPMTEDRSTCSYCAFRRVCGRDGGSAALAPPALAAPVPEPRASP